MAAYESTFRAEGELCFFSELPSLAHIGERFEELSDACFAYSAPADELDEWRQFSQQLDNLISGVENGAPQTWLQMELGLQAQFEDRFEQARQRVPAAVHEYFETEQMPLAEYLLWLQHGVETAWSLHSGAGNGPDMDRFEVRTKRLTQRLRTAEYETESDRQLRQEDPDRYEFLAQSAQLMDESTDDPSPEAFQAMVAQQMELFRQSPMFAESQRQLEQLRAQLTANPDKDPEVLKFQITQLEQTQRFMENPSAEIGPLVDAFNAEGEDDESDDDDAMPDWPPGHVRFSCGERTQITPDQITLYEQFVACQAQLRPQIEAALREMHGWMATPSAMQLPGDQLMFPEKPAESDVPLQCFSIATAQLDADHGRILLSLESQFGHFDEHGCYISIRDGNVDRFGTWDDVFGDDDLDA